MLTIKQKPTIAELDLAHRTIKNKLNFDIDMTKPIDFEKYSLIYSTYNYYTFNNGLCEELEKAISLIEVK
jgi:hypothetical protein